MFRRRRRAFLKYWDGTECWPSCEAFSRGVLHKQLIGAFICPGFKKKIVIYKSIVAYIPHICCTGAPTPQNIFVNPATRSPNVLLWRCSPRRPPSSRHRLSAAPGFHRTAGASLNKVFSLALFPLSPLAGVRKNHRRAQ